MSYTSATDMRSPEEPTILYFGNDWAAENRTSSHHIARCLARTYRVYYVECPGLRAPKTSGRDIGKILRKLYRFLQGPKRVPEGLTVQTLLQIPFHRFALVRYLNRLMIRATVRRLMRREHIQCPILWFMVPHLAPIVGHLNDKLSVYYCIDDFAALPDVDAAAIQALDNELTQKADLVFVASDTMLDAKRRLNPRTYVSPHGVDIEHWAETQDDDLAAPADIVNLSHPIVGFFGLIEKWIDLDLVSFLAKQRPQWTFVMIGRVAVAPNEIPAERNLHFIGRRPYESLPAYGKQFDVAIIPYHLNDQTLHANPIKLREYLAMGKPIVSVSTPEIDKFADVVEIAHSQEEFLAKLDVALARPSLPSEIERRTKRVATMGWETRVDEVMKLVLGQNGGIENLAVGS